MLKTLEKLCGLSGVSGSEEEVREYIKAEALKYTGEVSTDVMGNLIVIKRAADPSRSGKKNAPSLMLAAHMDEVGFMVKAITEPGYLRFEPVGGIDPRVAFDRKGVPVIALWTPEHLDINQQRIDGRLLIVTDGLREHLLPNPVIIDPIRRKVWDASGLVYRNPQGDDEFRAFPLMDYPLIVTDLAVFRDFIRP